MVWHQFYGRGDEDEDLEQSKQIEMVEELKTKEELLLHIDGLAKKGVVDKLQEFVEKYNGKVKVLHEVRQKISVLTLPSNYNQSKQKSPVPSSQSLSSWVLTPLNRITSIMSRVFHLLQKLLPLGRLSVLTYYCTIKSAIQQNLIHINLASKSNGFNLGMFYLYICRQWGQGLSREQYLMLCLSMMVILEKWLGEKVDDMDEMEIVREFVVSMDGCLNDGVQIWAKNYQSLHKSCSCLSQLVEVLKRRERGYSMDTVEYILVECLQKYLDYEQQGANILLHNTLPSISRLVVNPTNGKQNKLTNNIISIASLPLNSDSSANIQSNQWILKYIVVLTGEVDARIFKNEFDCEDGVKSQEEYSRWIYARVVERLVDGDLVGVNRDNVEADIKRIFHEKLNVFLPMLNLTRGDKNKSDTLLSSIINELLAKSSQNTPARKSKIQSVSVSQSASSSPAMMKIPDDFKIYIYHPNPKQLIPLIARCLNTNIEAVYEKLFMKNVGNQMLINYAIAKQLRSKYVGKKNDGDNDEMGVSSKSNSHQVHIKNIISIKTKNGISQHQQKPITVPSMHMLQTQQAHIISNPSMLKTSKIIGNGGQGQQLGSSYAGFMYEAVNKILIYLHIFLSERAGHVDFGGNYFNSWYFSPSYFNGIQKIVQGIANDNDDWSGYKSMAVICRIFKNVIVTSLSFFLKFHLTSLMDKIIQRLERPMVNSTSINRIKSVSISTKGIDQNKQLNNEFEMKKALDILGQALDQDLGDNAELCGQKKKEKDYNSVWNQFKEECQFVYFDKIWLQQVKLFLGIEIVERVANKSSQSILNAGVKNINEGLSKRSSRRSKNIALPSLDLLSSNKKKTSKETKQTGFKPTKTEIIQQNEQKQMNEAPQNKFLTEFSAHHFEMDVQTISTKLNLIKDDHQKMKKSLLTGGNLLKLQNRNYWLSNVIYSMCLVNSGGLMCNSWRAYVKDCLPREECQYLSVTLKSLIDKKCDVQRQLSKLAKDPLYSVDLISCTNPIDFIKAYIASQFESKIGGKQKNEDENQFLKNKKKQQTTSYCISNFLTEDQKKDKFIKLKSVLAVGWKLSSESTYELTQQDKLTQLTNIYICKKIKPQQMALCSVELFEDVSHKSDSIRLNVFTKKNVGNIGIKTVYIRT